jgi:hypothetical protein
LIKPNSFQGGEELKERDAAEIYRKGVSLAVFWFSKLREGPFGIFLVSP